MVNYQTLSDYFNQCSCMKEIIKNNLFDISKKIINYLFAFDSLSQSSLIPRIDDSVKTYQTPSRTLCHIRYMTFSKSCDKRFISYYQNVIVHPQDVLVSQV